MCMVIIAVQALRWIRRMDLKMTSQKLIARYLDDAATRADMIDRDMATGKQCWFLAKLMLENASEQAMAEVQKSNFVLTKRRASQMIDGYLN